MSGFKCIDCRRPTHREYYMVRDEAWLAAHPSRDGMLCIGCLEGRLGRELLPGDFVDAPVNADLRRPSDRLASRLTGANSACQAAARNRDAERQTACRVEEGHEPGAARLSRSSSTLGFLVVAAQSIPGNLLVFL